jgi:hypothetical protein
MQATHRFQADMEDRLQALRDDMSFQVKLMDGAKSK